MGWLIVIIVSLLLCGFVGPYARKRGRSGRFWVLISLIISPFLAILLLAILPNLEGERQIEQEQSEFRNVRHEELTNTKTCPKCAESAKMAAMICGHCGHDFTAESQVQTGRKSTLN